ncbi:MAG: DUF928 domain-containing protein [Microcoleaceae cyanobacterium MO_207.B10]|nr:DUF928 domain-containing protein [Microcoleaceae cyanobacterium MO_207.B10]
MKTLYKLVSKITLQTTITATVLGFAVIYPVLGELPLRNDQQYPSLLLGIKFEPPKEGAPRNGSDGGTRGRVRFNTTGDGKPKSSTAGGGTRGGTTFTPPGAGAPRSSMGGGTRGGSNVLPPGDSSDAGSGNSNILQNPVFNNQFLVPLLPETNYGRTVSERPTIFVYVPKMSAREIFFSLQDEQRNTIYQTKLKVSGDEGIVSFTLPPEAPELEMGKNYVWFFAPIEPNGVLRPDNYHVDGWIKRVETPTDAIDAETNSAPIEQASLYARYGIWYDTLEILISAKQDQPNNTILAREWRELLEQVGLKNIADYSLVERL